MARALCLARLAWALGEIPVGAIVLDKDGRIIGGGFNSSITSCDPTGHAEMSALRHAAKTLGNYRLCGCSLVVTLEPCLMCLGAIVHARISNLVFGAHDPKSGVLTSCLEGATLPFLNHRIAVLGNILSKECQEILHQFFHFRRSEKKQQRNFVHGKNNFLWTKNGIFLKHKV